MTSRYVVELFATRDPVLCAVCRAPSNGLGHLDRYETKIVWTCSHPVCLSAIKRVSNMTQKQVKAYELTAARAAMEKAGPYLDSIGKTDIALLDSDEYDEFLSLFVTEYQESIREQFKDTVPF